MTTETKPRRPRRQAGNVTKELEPVHIGLSCLCATCGEEETWTLYDRGLDPKENEGFTSYKLCADGPVCHKANYWLAHNDTRFSASGDAGKLKAHRPDLYTVVGTALKGGDPDAPLPSVEERELTEERDPYGDLVTDQRYTKNQQWERGVLSQRMAWLEWLAQDRLYDGFGTRALVEKGLRLRWMGIFGVKTVEDAPDDVIRLRADEVMNYKNSVSYEKFLSVLRPFFEHKYGPFHRKTLAAVLNHTFGVGPDPFTAAGDFEDIGGPAAPDDRVEPTDALPVDNEDLQSLL